MVGVRSSRVDDLLLGSELRLRKPPGLPKFLHFLSMGRSGETGERNACGALYSTKIVILVLHGVCGLQTVCLQYISLAKMACHFGSSSQGNLRTKGNFLDGSDLALPFRLFLSVAFLAP